MGFDLYGDGTNLGMLYNTMGRYEEALQVEHFLVFERGAAATTVENLVHTAQTLGRHALADSGLAILREQLPPGHPWIFEAAAGNAYSVGDLLLVDSLAREMASDSKANLRRAGREWLAALASMRGRVNEALALVDSAALRFIVHASLTAAAPELAVPYLETFRSQLTLGTGTPRSEHRWLGLIAYGYALAGDDQSARELLAIADSLAESNDFHPTGIGEQVLAVIALQEERVEDAVDHLRRAQAAEFGLLRWEVRLLLADAHAALGHLDESIAQYDTLTGTYRLHYWDRHISFSLRPLAHERLGSLCLQVGDTVAAAQHLSEFIELWKDADPELQPRVETARRLLAQLAAEGT
jgi:tetratricopeptide (TPR) repeat protein